MYKTTKTNMRRLITLALGAMTALGANAKLTVTQQRCNHQTGKLALVEGKATVGWHMKSDTCRLHTR